MATVIGKSVIGTIGKVIGVLLGIVVLGLLAVFLWLRAPDRPLEELQAQYATPASRYVDLEGGVRVHYREDGQAAGPVVLLLHGFGDAHTSFEGWWAPLGAQYRVITLDFPGHGLTSAPADYLLRGDALADFVEAFATKLGLGPVAVAGNSMGGGVAWRLAVRHPDRVRALVLVDAAGIPPDAPPKEIPLAFRILQYDWGKALLRNIDNTPLIREGLKADVVDDALITEAFVEALGRFPARAGPSPHPDEHRLHRRGGREAGGAGHDQGAHAGAAWRAGRDHPAVGGAQVCGVDPGGELKLYPDAGHLPQIEIPVVSAKDVLDFLAAVPPEGAAVSPAAAQPAP